MTTTVKGTGHHWLWDPSGSTIIATLQDFAQRLCLWAGRLSCRSSSGIFCKCAICILTEAAAD